MGCITSRNKKQHLGSTSSNPLPTITLGQRIRPKIRRASNLKMQHQMIPYTETLLQVSAEDLELANGILTNHLKSPREKTEIRGILLSHFLFNTLPLKNINNILSDFNFYTFDEDSVIISQNTIGKYFYLVNSGSVEVIVNGISKNVITKGGYFGEIALLHDTLRTATVKTLEPTTLWVLNRENFTLAVQSVSKSKYQENKDFLNKVHFFNILNHDQKEKMLGLLVSQDYQDGEVIVREGDPGEIFYIIKQGIVSCSIKGQELRQLKSGDFFGEQALLYTAHRTASVTAIGKVSLLSLGVSDLDVIFGNQLHEIIYLNSQKIALEKSKFLRFLNEYQIETCIKNMGIFSYNKGDIVFQIGSVKGEKIALVVKGRIVCGPKVLNLFDCFGDSYLGPEIKVFKKNWVADYDTDIAAIQKKELEKCLGGEINEIISHNQLLDVIRKIHLLRALPLDKLENLILVLKNVEFEDQGVIFKQGDPGEFFFIVKSGQVEIFKDGNLLRTITKDDFFGERSLILNENRTATVISKGNSSLWVLSKSDFFSIIDESIQKQLLKRIALQDDTITLEDLAIVKKIGHGMFGNVFLVYKTQNKSEYALKAVDRWKINEYNIYENIVLERRILLQLDHPMLMKLVKTFKDSTRIYFLMEYVSGIDLFDVIRSVEKMDEARSLFYVSCLLLILKYLHERKIMYRDLKPENVMIDFEGYPKLIDFGTAKIVENRTYTRVGTPHYMAPEVIQGSGYFLEADYWSLGIMLYEFVFFTVPFGEEETETYKIYKSIQEETLKIPSFASPDCVKLIECILNKDPSLRGNYHSIMKHSWFEGVNWQRLLAKQCKAPFLPQVENVKKLIESDNKEFVGDFQYRISEFYTKDPKISTKTRKIAANWDFEF